MSKIPPGPWRTVVADPPWQPTMVTARFALRVLWRALAVPAGLVQLWLSLRYAGFALDLCESPAADPVTLSLALLVAGAVSLRYAVRGES